jgi:hypothetical protein
MDDPSAAVRALPLLRAYDRRDIEAFLAVAEGQERLLRGRLERARARRAAAEEATRHVADERIELHPHLDAAAEELARGQAEHDAAVAALADASAAAARAILVEAERDAVALRSSLGDLLRQLDADAPAAPPAGVPAAAGR